MVFSEIDYAFYGAREALGTGLNDSRGYMIRTEAWKYVHFTGFPPQLFDLQNDPDEFNDLGISLDHAAIRNDMHTRLLDRLTARKNRVAMSEDAANAMTNTEEDSGILIGFWE
jgi:arylsulfatase A-like enzyme